MFSCSNPHRYLGIHLRHLHKFMSIEVHVIDSSNEYRKLHLSTRRSIAVVSEELCEIPLSLGDDWQLLWLDLADLCFRAYGTSYQSAAQVLIGATCRVAKVYFAGEFVFRYRKRACRSILGLHVCVNFRPWSLPASPPRSMLLRR